MNNSAGGYFFGIDVDEGKLVHNFTDYPYIESAAYDPGKSLRYTYK